MHGEYRCALSCSSRISGYKESKAHIITKNDSGCLRVEQRRSLTSNSWACLSETKNYEVVVTNSRRKRHVSSLHYLSSKETAADFDSPISLMRSESVSSSSTKSLRIFLHRKIHPKVAKKQQGISYWVFHAAHTISYRFASSKSPSIFLLNSSKFDRSSFSRISRVDEDTS